MWTEIFTMSGQFQALEAPQFYNLHISPLEPKTQEISFTSSLVSGDKYDNTLEYKNT